MLINCDNKGCLKGSNALLDQETLEVYCQECKRPIQAVSDSMKRALKSFGQIVRTNVKRSFTMACRFCGVNREVALNGRDETVCVACKNIINVHPSMKQAIKEVGQRIAEQTKAEAVEPAKTTKPRSLKKVKSGEKDNE